MKKIGILYNARIAAAENLASELVSKFESPDLSIWTSAASDEAKAATDFDATEMVISLGGDGTMLRVARQAARHGTPILGVNMGTLGFTTELVGAELFEKLPEFLAGEGWIDERTMLQVDLSGRSNFKNMHALNDIVVGRGAILRVIKISASVNDQPVTTYKGDGVIVATATGSTGYSLAAGGPILFPNANEILLTPITPHLGLRTPLVLSTDSVISLDVQTTHEARLSIDGQEEFPLNSGEVVKISRSPYTTKLLRIQPRTFFHKTLIERLIGK